MVNGTYDPAGVHNGKLTFQKRGDDPTCLRWDRSHGVWTFSRRAAGDGHNHEADPVGLCHCLELGLDDPRQAKTRLVRDDTSWAVQPAVTCVAAIPAVLFAGATGAKADLVNGAYDPVDVYNGKVLFQKRGDPAMWLHWDRCRANWIVRSAADKDNNSEGWCHCTDLALDDPREAKTWRVHDGSAWSAQATVACVSMIPPVLIGGVTGERAALIGGTYDPVSVYNGKALFQKRGDSDQWLRWVLRTKQWVVGSTASKDANDDLGSRRCVALDLDDPRHAKTWAVHDGTDWTTQPTVACVTFIPPVLIGGVSGIQAHVNGIYDPVGVYNGKVLFHQRDCGRWLRWVSTRMYWMVSPTVNKDANDNMGWCHCLDLALDDPRQAKTWTVGNGVGWSTQPAVACVSLVPSVLVGGVTGAKAADVNGTYDPAGVHNAKAMFQKRGDKGTRLRWDHGSGSWMVSRVSAGGGDHNREADHDVGLCHCLELGLDDPRQAKTWRVCDDTSWAVQPAATCVAAIPAVLFAGATGAKADLINGTYDPVDVYNGKVLFQKRGDPATWLRWDRCRANWIVSSAADKDDNNSAGWCYCTDLALDDPRHAKTWRVHDGSAWSAQATVACVSMIPPVLIGGVTGERAALVSGTFDPVSVYNSKALFQKRGDTDQWLRWVPRTKQWAVGSTANKDANDDLGSCCCVDLDLDDPRQDKTWAVHDGADWKVQPAVACVSWIPPVLIDGVTGSTAPDVNGTYDPVGVCNGKVLFQRREGDRGGWLRWVPTCKHWMVSKTASKDANDDIGWCHCAEKDLDDPRQAKTWAVWDGAAFNVQREVNCVSSIAPVLLQPQTTKRITLARATVWSVGWTTHGRPRPG
jgi:hypothetical protein